MTRNVLGCPDRPGNTGVIQAGYFCCGIAALAAGIALYASFRAGDMLLYRLFPRPRFLDALYHPVHAAKSSLAAVLVYNVPDGLWFLSGLLLIRGLWLRDTRWHKRYYLVFVTIGMAIELSQISERVPGTFDAADLLAMAISAFVEGVIYVFMRRSMVC
ncbi:MAG: hypothetical protein LBR16_05935 [Treponema sp.]|jgi:hypothetical protein|nr:hypothetical protein [Treponema sp.]